MLQINDIKYRVWDKVRQQMFYSSTGVRGSNGVINLASIYTGYADSSEWENYVYMRYIGLEDILGEEIYEGDLVRITIPVTEFNEKNFGIVSPASKLALIKWYKDDACFSAQFEPLAQWHPCYEHARLCDTDTTIAGNIYENPEPL